MKKIVKIVLVFALAFIAVPLPLGATEGENSSEITEQQNEQVVYGDFSATDFVVFTEDLNSLTEQKVIELANVTTPEGIEVSVDTDQFNALKDAKDTSSKKITFSAGEQTITVTATIKDSNMLIAPASEVTDGEVTIDIPDYDPATGMVVGQTYAVKVSVPFRDYTSTGKQVKITLPEGLRYQTIPVTGTPKPGTPQVTADSQIYGFIESFTAPDKHPVYQTFNGDLVYNFFSTTGGVEISFIVAVDQNLYYGPKLFTQDTIRGYEGITVTAQKSGSQIGEAKMDINATGNVQVSPTSTGGWGERDALINSNIEVETPNSGSYRSGILYGTYNSLYVQHAKHTYYFPKELNYIRSNNESKVTEVNTTDGYVIFEASNIFANSFGISANLYLNTLSDNLVPNTTYTAKDFNSQELIMYDGTVKEVQPVFKLIVNIKDQSSVTNKLSVSAKNTDFFDVADASRNYTSSIGRFVVQNDNLSEKNGQYLEYEIEDGFEADEVVLPVNKATTTKIEYKTNKNGTIRSTTEPDMILVADTTKSSKITVESLGLAEDEYITFVRVALPDIAPGWKSGRGTDIGYGLNTTQVRGMLADGVQRANAIIRTYAHNIEGEIDLDTLSEATSTVNRVSNSSASVSMAPKTTTPSGSMLIGKTYKINFSLNAPTYFYADTLAVRDPSLYIRIPAGVIINPRTVSVSDSQGKSFNVTPSDPYVSDISGERFIEVKIPGTYGSLVNGATNDLTVTVDFSTTLASGGSYNWSEYAFWMDKAQVLKYATVSGITPPIFDVMDVDNNGVTTEKILPSAGAAFSIAKEEILIIDTFITPEGESRRGAFDGTASTAVGFTPGTNAKYTLDILNNRPNTVDSVISYIPIPKEGYNFGREFQDSDDSVSDPDENLTFKWNMKLGAEPTIKVIDEVGNDITSTSGNNYVIEYATDATSKENYSSATYSPLFTADATMIKVTNTSGIPSKERATLEFSYVVDETTTTVAENPSKLSSINNFRPVYDFVSGVSSGRQFGTRVGAQLVIGEVKGFMFKDGNYDGIYTAVSEDPLSKDSPLVDRDVNLYNSANELVSTVKTTALGTYSFEGLQNGSYRVDFNDGITGDEMFTFANRGTESTLQSHVANVGPNKGLALTVDPTSDRAKNINAGVFDYNPATDLKVTASEESVTMPATNAQTSFSVQVNRTIDPTFFSSIRATTDGEVWSSDDTNIATVTGGLIRGVNPGPTTVRVKITDIFGNTAEDTVTVVVTSNDLPVITAPDVTTEKGEPFDPLASPTAEDTEDGDLTADITLVSSDVDANVVGNYNVTVRVQDSQGNIVDAIYAVEVEDTTAPVITANATQTYERLSTVTPEQFLLDVEASMNEAGTLTSDFATVVDLSVAKEDGYTVTLTAIDDEGNESEKTVVVKVEDTTAPVITANATQTYVRLSTVTPEQFILDVEASMNEAGTLTSDFATAVDLSVAKDSYTVTITGTDLSMNESTKTVAVKVEDTTAPVITANATQTYERLSTVTPEQFLLDVEASMNEAGTLTSDFATAVDLSIAKEDSYTVTITGTDLSTNTSTKTVAVKVEDTTAPVITANATQTYERLSTVTPEQFILDVEASMNEAGTLTSDFATAVDLSVTKDSYTVTITGTDLSMNESTKTVVVTVEDTTAPVITANATQTYERLSTVTPEQFLVDVQASLNEAGTLTSDFATAVDLSVAKDSYTVTITGTDTIGNVASKTVAVKVADTTAPIVRANPFIVYERLSTVSAEQFLIDVNAQMDEAGTLTSNFSTIVDLNKSDVYNVTITGEDLSQNTHSITVAVTVSDKTPGAITALNNVRYERLSTVTPEQFLLDVEASMNEAGTLTSNFSDIVDLTVTGSYEVTLTGTDEAGNVSTRLVMVIVSDGTEPKFTYNGEIINFEFNIVKNYERLSEVTNEQFLADIPVGLNEPGTITTNFAEVIDLTVTGEYQVRLTGTDLSNNETSILVTVVVIDTVAPVITGNATHTYERLSTSSAAQFLLDVNAQMNEAGTITSDFDTVVDLAVSGDYTVTITGTDLSGNEGTLLVTVSVADTTAPVVTANATQTYEQYSTVTAAQFLLDVAASMNEEGTLSSDFTTVVDLNVVGDAYTVTISGVDKSGNIGVTTVNVIVVAPDISNLVISANDVELTQKELADAIASDTLESELLAKSGARIYNKITQEEYGPLTINQADLQLLKGASVGSVQELSIMYEPPVVLASLDNKTDVTSSATQQVVKKIQVSIVASDDGTLVTTGENNVFAMIGIILIVVGSIIIFFKIRRKYNAQKMK